MISRTHQINLTDRVETSSTVASSRETKLQRAESVAVAPKRYEEPAQTLTTFICPAILLRYYSRIEFKD